MNQSNQDFTSACCCQISSIINLGPLTTLLSAINGRNSWISNIIQLLTDFWYPLKTWVSFSKLITQNCSSRYMTSVYILDQAHICFSLFFFINFCNRMIYSTAVALVVMTGVSIHSVTHSTPTFNSALNLPLQYI